MADENKADGQGDGSDKGGAQGEDKSKTGAGAQGQGSGGAQGQDQGKGGQGDGQGDQGKGKARTLADDVVDGGDDEGQGKPPGDWPADWREKYAKGDEKKLGRLKRYTSPEAVMDALIAAQNRIASGELKAPLPEDATPEQVAEYRKTNGIPEKPEGYLEKLPDGIVIGEDDKERVTTFTKDMHDANVPPGVVHKALQWYYRTIEAEHTERAAADQASKVEAEEALRAEYGPEYRPNLQGMIQWLETGPKGLKDLILNGRLADGTPIGNHPDALKFLVSAARELNPFHTVVGANGGLPGKGIDDEIADIESKMGDKSSEYWQGPKADGMQKRYRDLVTARDRREGRTKAA